MKITKDDKLRMAELARQGVKQVEIAKQFDVTQAHVSHILATFAGSTEPVDPDPEWSIIRRANAPGLDVVQVVQYWRAHTDACDACGLHVDHTLHTDHDHVTGEFRDLLCRSCNVTLGNVGDDVDRLRMLVRYLDEK